MVLLAETDSYCIKSHPNASRNDFAGVKLFSTNFQLVQDPAFEWVEYQNIAAACCTGIHFLLAQLQLAFHPIQSRHLNKQTSYFVQKEDVGFVLLFTSCLKSFLRFLSPNIKQTLQTINIEAPPALTINVQFRSRKSYFLAELAEDDLFAIKNQLRWDKVEL